MATMLSTLAQNEHSKEEGTKNQVKFLTFINKNLEDHKDLQVEFSVIKAGFYEATNQFRKAMETLMVVQEEKKFSTYSQYSQKNFRRKNFFNKFLMLLKNF